MRATRSAPQAPKPKMDPAQYFAALRANLERAERTDNLQGRLVDRSRVSSLFDHMDVTRRDGVKIRFIPELFGCFYDIPVEKAMEILDVSDRSFKSLRTWCGASRWPRTQMMLGKHPLITLKMVCDHRINMMNHAFGADPLIYSLLYAAHKLAGYNVHGEPSGERAAFAQQAPQPRGKPRRKEQQARVKATAHVRPEYLAPEESLGCGEQALPEQAFCEQAFCEQTLPEQAFCEQALPEQAFCEQALPEQALCDQDSGEQALCGDDVCGRRDQDDYFGLGAYEGSAGEFICNADDLPDTAWDAYLEGMATTNAWMH